MLDIPEDIEFERREEEAENAEASGSADGLQALGEERPIELEPQEAQIVVGPVLPEQLEVNGVLLTEQSSLATLRAGCAFYEISRSGGKAKCYRRLAQHQKKLELLAAQQSVAQHREFLERHPKGQTLVKPPNEQEQETHELTHVPYKPWCEACLKHRARPDRHIRTGESHATGIPVVSMDFCVTKSKEDLAPPEEGDPQKGALWLVLTCNHTGYIGVIPVKTKGQLNYVTHEVMAFVQLLGWEEVAFYGDNEPIIRQILKTVVTTRHALGLKTKIYTTKIKDSAGNSLAENTIQRVRQLACTLVQDVSQRTHLSFGCDHAIWSWAGRHAAWLLNRFQPVRGATSFELIYGRPFTGKVCRFAEPIFGYCKPRGKADAKWRIGLFLGKTEAQDAWIVGDGTDVMLTKSIRRVDKPWTKMLAYYTGLQTHSYVYQTNFGGRIVPTKRTALALPHRGRLFPSLVDVEQRFRDEEAEAVLAYALSAEGRLEAQQEVQEALAEDGADKQPDVVEPSRPSEIHSEAPPFSLVEGASSAASGLAAPASPRQHGTKTPASVSQNLMQEEPEAKRTRVEEQLAKRARIGSVTLIARIQMVERRLEKVAMGDDVFYHLDEVKGEDDLNAWRFEDEHPVEVEVPVDEKRLWSDEPLTRTPPEPDPEIDKIADGVEVSRLVKMGVLTPLNEDEFNLEVLTTRSVYDWRIKLFALESGETVRKWMRRSRLVAREFANQKRDDVHSPASGHHSLRLIPILFLAMRSMDGVECSEAVIGSLDVKDAFLQVDQEKPVRITTKVGHFRVRKNLPGQRIGAKAWFDHITQFMMHRGFVFCPENPCLGRKDGSVFVLIHVDDILFCGMKSKSDGMGGRAQEHLQHLLQDGREGG